MRVLIARSFALLGGKDVVGEVKGINLMGVSVAYRVQGDTKWRGQNGRG